MLRVGKKKFISEIILLAILVIIFGYVFSSVKANKVSMLIVLGFVLIGVLSLANIIKDTRIISSNKFFWYFQFVFMSIAPLCQYLSGYYPWSVRIDDPDMGIAQLMVLFWSGLYMLFYRGLRIKVGTRDVGVRIRRYLTVSRDMSPVYLVVVFVIAMLSFAILVRMVGFYDLFFRSENTLDIENFTVNFVVKKILTALPAMVCAIFLLIVRKKKSLLMIVGIIALAFVTVCSNFPTSTTRYWMGTIFIGIFFVGFIKRKESRLIDYGIIFGLLVVFPIFFWFKTMTVTDLFAGRIKLSGITESFNTIDFDAFTLVARSVRYVRENGITWGQQLINIILFFIPRGIWKTKPITTNVLIASSQNQTYTNLSCPLPAEGYVNFGWIGIIVYCFVYAKFNHYIDEIFWNRSSDDQINIINLIYPFLCIITLYINRGPLQPSFIQTVALVLPLIVIVMFSRKRKKE